ncbi:MAG: hypothetical protein JWM80_4849 [Cyanobacteria bacterium RYN_339]|nr:hypothetical protein [Cyanobacteria bacterium RYN_339]
MNRLLLAVIAFVTLAGPAAAAPNGYIDPRWDKDVAKALGKLKVGMDANQAQNVFATIEAPAQMDTVDFKSKVVQEFAVTSTKQRVYLNANFFQLGSKQTAHKAVLVFQAPLGEFRGAKAKLVRWGLVDKFTFDALERVEPVTVATQAEIPKLQRFKF